MEISYYVECLEKVYIRNKRSENQFCLNSILVKPTEIVTSSQPILEPKVALILNNRVNTNKPLTASFDGEFIYSNTILF